ncbi:hypothetical protein RN001_002729 [Aquatica leii]|uniref:Uncharacterized protein n=1 Tax=Aquatica leii TaxID=1421715 RepID=A0AAN7QNP0_9COLE|nr:hypothetical protein RN001_002729 [Aquatica leii]
MSDWPQRIGQTELNYQRLYRGNCKAAKQYASISISELKLLVSSEEQLDALKVSSNRRKYEQFHKRSCKNVWDNAEIIKELVFPKLIKNAKKYNNCSRSFGKKSSNTSSGPKKCN